MFVILYYHGKASAYASAGITDKRYFSVINGIHSLARFGVNEHSAVTVDHRERRKFEFFVQAALKRQYRKIALPECRRVFLGDLHRLAVYDLGIGRRAVGRFRLLKIRSIININTVIYIISESGNAVVAGVRDMTYHVARLNDIANLNVRETAVKMIICGLYACFMPYSYN